MSDSPQKVSPEFIEKILGKIKCFLESSNYVSVTLSPGHKFVRFDEHGWAVYEPDKSYRIEIAGDFAHVDKRIPPQGGSGTTPPKGTQRPFRNPLTLEGPPKKCSHCGG